MMKKRWICAALCLALCIGLFAVAGSAVGFPDVTDPEAARDAEVLRLMGVMEGDPSGAFRPNEPLTRAQFCKMAVVLMGQDDAAHKAASRTIFPDVRASHWACGWVNVAVTGERAFIRGLPDGTFAPERAITYGEAATILMRMLGYTDADADGLWPQGYLNLAEAAGLGGELALAANASVSRAQAAHLFVQMLTCRTKGGEPYTADGKFSVSDKETTLYSVRNGKLTTNDSVTAYDMTRNLTSDLFTGMRGYLVLDKNGKVLSFLPTYSGTAAASNAAVMIRADGSTDGLDAITGGRTDYTIVKNGIKIGAQHLREHDVATYDRDRNEITVCDTRISVYYESCAPSAAEPLTVRTLGGTEFSVLPEARQSVAQFKPGEEMTLLLTAEGDVAAAAGAGAANVPGNALVFVGADGTVRLICGGKLGKTLSLKDVLTNRDTMLGCVARVQQTEKKRVTLLQRFGGSEEALNAKEGKLGKHAISRNVLLFDKGEQIAYGELQNTDVNQVQFARLNELGEVDILVLRSGASGIFCYGRASVEEMTEDGYLVRYLTLSYFEDGQARTLGPFRTSYMVKDGDFVEAMYKGSIFSKVTVLPRHLSIPASSWIGTSAINAGGRTFSVSPNVSCYNLDAEEWMPDLETALAYGRDVTAYVQDGTVRILTVKS
ncbi:MAG: S-layer homology domain-containing protein [Oscillospiraceae bacterium]|nr:S-layer homology domain-containing protein [Oscillospiraceae bacterium]